MDFHSMWYIVFILDAQNIKTGKYLSTSPIRTIAVWSETLFSITGIIFLHNTCAEKGDV